MDKRKYSRKTISVSYCFVAIRLNITVGTLNFHRVLRRFLEVLRFSKYPAGFRAIRHFRGFYVLSYGHPVGDNFNLIAV